MKFIATDVLDNREKMAGMARAQLDKKGFAIDPYFYRSHVTYQAELENIIFKSWLYAGLCTLFSVLGGMAGYLIGKLAFAWIEPWLMASSYADTFTGAVQAFKTWGFWYILLAGFTPIPYKVFTISAGVVGMPFLAFIGGSVVGRGGRFFLGRRKLLSCLRATSTRS